MTDLNVFRIFVSAAEAGSFATAATALGLTRSAVAKAVSRLEQQTGTRLFQRTTRVVTLTNEGQALYARATDTIRELEAALDDLAGRGEEPRGVLKMTAPDAYGRIRVLPALTKFLTSWPKLEADITFNDRTVDVVAEGYDLALRVGASDVGQDLISRVLARHRVSFCASPEYLARYGKPETLDDLKEHACLQFVQRGRRQPWPVRGENGEIAMLDTEGRVRMDNGQAIRDAAVGGLGIVQMADFLIEPEITEGRLQRFLEANEPDPVPIVALYPTRKYLAPKVRLFIDSLVGE
jgi:DNA-binding transcriptional LysR family regulator